MSCLTWCASFLYLMMANAQFFENNKFIEAVYPYVKTLRAILFGAIIIMMLVEFFAPKKPVTPTREGIVRSAVLRL